MDVDFSEIQNLYNDDNYKNDCKTVRLTTGKQSKPQLNPKETELNHKGTWYLSSSKIGNGLTQLLNDDLTQYWQSDGSQPHFLEVFFQRKHRFSSIFLYLDKKSDESYTPYKLLIKARTVFEEEVDVMVVSIDDPYGWFEIKLCMEEQGLITNLMKIVFVSNLHQGKDIHLRCIKLVGEGDGRGSGGSEFDEVCGVSIR